MPTSTDRCGVVFDSLKHDCSGLHASNRHSTDGRLFPQISMSIDNHCILFPHVVELSNHKVIWWKKGCWEVSRQEHNNIRPDPLLGVERLSQNECRRMNVGE